MRPIHQQQRRHQDGSVVQQVSRAAGQILRFSTEEEVGVSHTDMREHQSPASLQWSNWFIKSRNQSLDIPFLVDVEQKWTPASFFNTWWSFIDELFVCSWCVQVRLIKSEIYTWMFLVFWYRSAFICLYFRLLSLQHVWWLVAKITILMICSDHKLVLQLLSGSIMNRKCWSFLG